MLCILPLLWILPLHALPAAGVNSAAVVLTITAPGTVWMFSLGGERPSGTAPPIPGDHGGIGKGLCGGGGGGGRAPGRLRENAEPDEHAEFHISTLLPRRSRENEELLTGGRGGVNRPPLSFPAVLVVPSDNWGAGEDG